MDLDPALVDVEHGRTGNGSNYFQCDPRRRTVSTGEAREQAGQGRFALVTAHEKE
jgi:hypothetical protein